jgi:phosphoribosylglycinamide formyltransferase 1
MRKFLIMISGRGSNMQALLEAHREGRLQAEPVLVIHNREQAGGVAVAQSFGVPTEWIRWHDPAAAEQQVIQRAAAVGAEWIVLAGFMRVLSPRLIDAFPHRIINIHPSLLPSFPGLHAQQQALAYGVRISGCTTHFVNAGVDTGPVILQRMVPVQSDDTDETLSARILVEEHRALVETVQLFAENRIVVEGRRTRIIPAQNS